MLVYIYFGQAVVQTTTRTFFRTSWLQSIGWLCSNDEGGSQIIYDSQTPLFGKA